MASGTARIDQARALFRRHGGMLKTGEARALGIHPRTLYEMRDQGLVEQLAWGLYRLADLPPLAAPDLVPVAVRIPEGVICLISALAFHEITTQIPRVVHVAIRRNARPPGPGYPPTQVFRFSGKAFAQGIEEHEIDGTSVRIYSVEKTLADCFKYRNRIGLDTAVEALQLYRQRKPMEFDKILEYARTCRVARVITPYLESIL